MEEGRGLDRDQERAEALSALEGLSYSIKMMDNRCFEDVSQCAGQVKSLKMLKCGYDEVDVCFCDATVLVETRLE